MRTILKKSIYQVTRPERRLLTVSCAPSLGYVHNDELELFRVGRTVGAGVRKFVENGDSEIMEQESEHIP